MLETAPQWSIQQGAIPLDFQEILDAAGDRASREGVMARNRLAGLYAALGLYEEAMMIDRELTIRSSPPPEASRRLVWCLLRQDRLEDALAATRGLQRGALESHLAAAVRTIARERNPEIRARMASFVPFLSRADGARLASGRVPVAARSFPGLWSRQSTFEPPGTDGADLRRVRASP
jgi:hypothetical protein